MSDEWRQTVCILCSVNCGIEVKLEGRHIARVRGNRAHVASRGYACEKAQRLDYYQNARDRLTSPLRRRPDGTFEEIDWDTAIREVAAGFVRVRDRWGGPSIFYYGGGGQGNHLVGSYGASTRRALGSVFRSNALAQEKTGEFWVDHMLLGTGIGGSYDLAEVAIFVGKNPWQSHGFQRARPILRDIASDPNRALIVIDPRRTETAEMADYHLRLRPGTDAFCLAAILGVLVQEDLVDHDFIRDRAKDADELFAVLNEVPVADYCDRAGLGVVSPNLRIPPRNQSLRFASNDRVPGKEATTMTMATLQKLVRDPRSGEIHLPSEHVEILGVMRNLDRTLLRVKWQRGGDCILFPHDIEDEHCAGHSR